VELHQRNRNPHIDDAVFGDLCYVLLTVASPQA
jgi:hypothetical protein